MHLGVGGDPTGPGKNSHIFLFGGHVAVRRAWLRTMYCLTSVWKSGDAGFTWELVTEDAGWAPRDAFAFGALEPCAVSCSPFA